MSADSGVSYMCAMCVNATGPWTGGGGPLLTTIQIKKINSIMYEKSRIMVLNIC